MSFQFQRKAVTKNVQITGQLCSFHMLVRLCSKSFKLAFSSSEQRTSRCKGGFRKGRGSRDQIANIYWIRKKGNSRKKNVYFYFIDHTKTFHCVDDNKLWKIFKEMGISDHLTCLVRNLFWSRSNWTWNKFCSKLGKEKQGCKLTLCLFNICRVHHEKC